MKIGAVELSVSPFPALMGVINTTPDSFFSGSRTPTADEALSQALAMVRDGATLIDIGGESTRPGSTPVTIEEEMARTIPVLELLRRHLSVPLSIDTCKAEVAERAMNAGASMINDIGGLAFDPSMADVVKNTGASVVIMHMQGTPEKMQHNPFYKDPVKEVTDWLLKQAAFAERKGISPEKIILDPGIGFGKRVGDNLLLIRDGIPLLSRHYPVLIGHSRKKFIGTLTSHEQPEERLAGSLGAAVMSAHYGAAILRVHDPLETKDALTIALAIRDAAKESA